MIIDCIGCLHGYNPKLEGGDLLIVTGDLTKSDKIDQYSDFFSWFSCQNYSHKVIIAGNHDNEIANGLDFSFEDERIYYLEDSGIEIDGMKIWGTPWSPRFPGINPKCCAFTYFDETRFYDEHVITIPKDIDILITHTPAFGILDGIPNEDGSDYHAGSKALEGWLKYVHRPRLHVFSHIHEAHGQTEYFPVFGGEMMISVNCSIMNEKYKPVNAPVRIFL